MRQWMRYQSMWKDVFKEWARIVLQSAQTYPQEQRSRYKKPIAEMTITVTMPAALSSAEFAELVAALGTLTAGNILRPEEAAHVALSMPELGIEDPDEVYKAMFPVEAEGGPDAVTLPAAPSAPTPEDKLSTDKTPTQAATAERAILEAAIRRIMDGDL